MLAAVAATTSPMANTTMPPVIGRPAPMASHSRPPATVANSCPIRNTENAQA